MGKSDTKYIRSGDWKCHGHTVTDRAGYGSHTLSFVVFKASTIQHDRETSLGEGLSHSDYGTIMLIVSG